MLLRPLLLSHVGLRVLTLAIVLVVGRDVGPHLSTRGATAAVVSQAERTVLEDAGKGSERIGRRLAPAHSLDRLLPTHASIQRSVVAAHADTLADGAAILAVRPLGEQRPIVKHVPRMERGDPPRT